MKSSVRRQVLVLFLKTLFFTVLLFSLFFLYRRCQPQWTRSRLDAALIAGKTDKARKLSSRFSEAEAGEILRQCSYIDAEKAEALGAFAEAAELFEAANTYADAKERRDACIYARARELESIGKYEQAAELFGSLRAYGDAYARSVDCLCAQAQALAEAGDLLHAAEILKPLIGNEKAKAALLPIAEELTGEEGEAALSAVQGISPEKLADNARLSSLRAVLPKHTLDVGFYHTVALSETGCVYACGDNRYGQCDSEAWENVVGIAAGAWHTLALLQDGTVVAAGRNTEGQCEVSSWRDIVEIAASDYASFGLTKSGKLLHTGYGDYSETENWSNLTGIFAGSYNIAAMGNDGSIWVYPELSNSEPLQGCVELSLHSGYALGLMQDGTVFCTAAELPSWENVLTISAGSNGILALLDNGTIQAHFFRASAAVDLSSVKNAVAIAAGGTHYAAAFSDGSVKVFGSADYGEDKTDTWIIKQ